MISPIEATRMYMIYLAMASVIAILGYFIYSGVRRTFSKPVRNDHDEFRLKKEQKVIRVLIGIGVVFIVTAGIINWSTGDHRITDTDTVSNREASIEYEATNANTIEIVTNDGVKVGNESIQIDKLALGENNLLIAQDKNDAYLPSVLLGENLDRISLQEKGAGYQRETLAIQPFQFDDSSFDLLGGHLSLSEVSTQINDHRSGAGIILQFAKTESQLLETEGYFDIYDAGIPNVFILVNSISSSSSAGKVAKIVLVSKFYEHGVVHIAAHETAVSFYEGMWSVRLQSSQQALMEKQANCTSGAQWSCATVVVTDQDGKAILGAKVNLHYDVIGVPKDYLVYTKDTNENGKVIFPLVADRDGVEEEKYFTFRFSVEGPNGFGDWNGDQCQVLSVHFEDNMYHIVLPNSGRKLCQGEMTRYDESALASSSSNFVLPADFYIRHHETWEYDDGVKCTRYGNKEVVNISDNRYADVQTTTQMNCSDGQYEEDTFISVVDLITGKLVKSGCDNCLNTPTYLGPAPGPVTESIQVLGKSLPVYVVFEEDPYPNEGDGWSYVWKYKHYFDVATGILVRTDSELEYYYEGELQSEYSANGQSNIAETNIPLGFDQ